MSMDNEMVACTEFNTSKFTFTWIIKDYSLVIKDVPEENLTSPEFSLSNDPERKFYLKLYPGGENEKCNQFISLFLHTIKNDKKPEFVCKCTFSTLTKVGGSSIYEQTLHEKFSAKATNWGWSNYYEKKNYQKLLAKDGSMIIYCKLSVTEGCTTSIISEFITEKLEVTNKPTFDSLFLSEELSDVKLKFDGENDIPAHKTILSLASPVFKTMFSHDMLENLNNAVKITDTSYNTLVEMLRYIYTGAIESTGTDMILQLLAVADKYQIDNLKIKCENILSANLNIKNVIEILLAAHKYNVKYLKNRVKKFVITHIKLFFNSEKIEQIDDPDTIVDLMQLILKLQENVS